MKNSAFQVRGGKIAIIAFINISGETIDSKVVWRLKLKTELTSRLRVHMYCFMTSMQHRGK